MEFLLFDLDCDDHAALHQARYDVVLIANALHAAKHLGRSIERVRRILQPGGLVVLIETTKPQAWHDVSTGLIEGWQHFADGIRGESPLLSVDQWQEELARHGFTPAVRAPQADQPTHALGMHVLVAQTPLHPDRQQPGTGDGESVTQIASPFGMTATSGIRAPFEAVDLEVADPSSQAVASVAHFREAIEAAPSSQRLQLLLDCTQTAVAETLGRKSLPRRDDRLMDLGLDSLMAIELRNRLQQALALSDLPSTLIFDYPTCGLIASFLLIKLGFFDSPHPLSVFTQSDFNQAGGVQTLNNHAAAEPSEAELDNMSSEQIAELLRMQLEP